MADIFTNTFNVLDFGADPLGVASSHQAFQDAIDAAKAVARGPGYGAWRAARCGTVLVPKGSYIGIGSLDCTSAVGLTIEGQGSWGSAVYADEQTQSAPVFDFTQSSYCQIKNLTIHGSHVTGEAPAVVPNSGVFFADSLAAPGSSNKNSLWEVNIYGHFANAALTIYRSCNNNVFSCALHNDRLNGAALFIGNVNNQLPVVSLYQPLAASGFVANENAFYGCEFHGAKTASAQIAPVWICGGNTVRVFGGIIDSNGTNQPCVYFPTSSNQHMFSGVKFYTEGGFTPGSVFYTPAVVYQLVCIGTFKDAGLSAIPSTSGPGSFPGIQLNGL